MRTYDIAYVPRGCTVGYPTKPLEELRLDEIKKKYITTCAKAKGNLSVCKTCSTQCEYGKRALSLANGEVFEEDVVPLYDGMTMIERAKLENMLRRQQKGTEEKEMKSKRLFIKDWYKQALASGDPVKWVMDTYKIDRNKAMAKLCQWRNRHKVGEPKKDLMAEKPKAVVESVKTIGFEAVEVKIDSLMKTQEEYKQAMLKYQKLYDETKRKIDILCRAMDIVNE